VIRTLRKFVDSRELRKLASRLSPMLPTEWSLRLKVAYSQQSAAAEIAKLQATREPMDAVLFRPVGTRFLDVLTPTGDLLRTPGFSLSERPRAASWPSDLPFASVRPSLS
jgi:hypothetical protein